MLLIPWISTAHLKVHYLISVRSPNLKYLILDMKIEALDMRAKSDLGKTNTLLLIYKPSSVLAQSNILFSFLNYEW